MIGDRDETRRSFPRYRGRCNASQPGGSGVPAGADTARILPRVYARMEVAMKSILDPTFKYTPSSKTDVRKTFARLRREAEAKKRELPAVVYLPRKESK